MPHKSTQTGSWQNSTFERGQPLTTKPLGHVYRQHFKAFYNHTTMWTTM